jgi:hypothetical protein
MHLMQMNRPALLATVRELLPRRFRQWFDDGRVNVIGVFRDDLGGNWALGIRFKLDRRRPVYVRVREVRTPSGFKIVALTGSAPFDWREYRASLYVGDNAPAYRRLHERARNDGKDRTG